MAVKYFLKHGLPFEYNLDTKMSKRINVMKCTNQRFGLGFKLGKKNYKRATKAKKERRLAQIEGLSLMKKV
jgi:hypothetical protein